MLLLIALFIAVPIAELYVIIKVGGAIGVGPTIALLLLDGILGAALLRAQGRSAWIRFNRALAEGRVPGREAADGVLIIFGGALLLTPGFLSDVVGLLLLIPPTRIAIRAAGLRLLRRRMASGRAVASWGYARVGEPRARGRGADSGSDDIEGTARELADERELPRE